MTAREFEDLLAAQRSAMVRDIPTSNFTASTEMPTLTKAELAEMLLGLNKQEAKEMVEAFFGVMRDAGYSGVGRYGNVGYVRHPLYTSKMDTHLCIHDTLRPMSAKDVGIRIRVEKELREAFQSACLAEERQVSDVLREFMRAYADQHHDGKQASVFTAPSRKARKSSKRKT
jgi:hypothetical protein